MNALTTLALASAALVALYLTRRRARGRPGGLVSMHFERAEIPGEVTPVYLYVGAECYRIPPADLSRALAAPGTVVRVLCVGVRK